MVFLDHLVQLPQVQVVGLKPLQTLIENLEALLLAPTFPAMRTKLGHQKNLLTAGTCQRLTHQHLAAPVVVVPGIVEKVNALIDRAVHDPDRFLVVLKVTNMGPAQCDERYFFPGLAQWSSWHVARGCL
jgi:hypothetical protein